MKGREKIPVFTMSDEDFDFNLCKRVIKALFQKALRLPWSDAIYAIDLSLHAKEQTAHFLAHYVVPSLKCRGLDGFVARFDTPSNVESRILRGARGRGGGW